MQIEHRSKRHPDGTVELRLLFDSDESSAPPTAWPANYLSRLNLYLGGSLIMEGTLKGGLASEPVFAFRLQNTRPGERLEILWQDRRGNQGRLGIVLP